MGGIRSAFERAVRREFRSEGKVIDSSALLTVTVQRLISDLEAIEASDCFGDVSDTDLLRQYAEVADDAIDQCFNRIALEGLHRRLLRQACGLVLQRDSYSDLSTGFVFAGFGTEELSPSLVAYQVDGIVSGCLKKQMTEKVVTHRREVIGEISPFAQREMVDRFLYGIDPGYETGIEHFLKLQTEIIREGIAESRSSMPQEAARILDDIIDAANAVALTGWRERMMPVVKAQFMREVQDMILLMPKQELATLAEELVNLTSVKRKFSSGIESVGGPIDVALISRNDGFVWVHRKHYFDPGLNPRYFHRKFGAWYA